MTTIEKLKAGESPQAVAAANIAQETAEKAELVEQFVEELVTPVEDDEPTTEELAVLSTEGDEEDVADKTVDERTAVEEAFTVVPDKNVEQACRLLVQTYACLLAARHHSDEVSAPSRDMLLARLAQNVLTAVKTLGLVEAGGVRAAITEAGAAEEFHLLTGVRPAF